MGCLFRRVYEGRNWGAVNEWTHKVRMSHVWNISHKVHLGYGHAAKYDHVAKFKL